jgi:hypothetical protein
MACLSAEVQAVVVAYRCQAAVRQAVPPVASQEGSRVVNPAVPPVASQEGSRVVNPAVHRVVNQAVNRVAHPAVHRVARRVARRAVLLVVHRVVRQAVDLQAVLQVAVRQAAAAAAETFAACRECPKCQDYRVCPVAQAVCPEIWRVRPVGPGPRERAMAIATMP